ncbi:MAG: PD40 domain-containing protein [Chloroflexi bacterium]|nr:PD40 domain-containing protein [Chloroflexota bacterium]
MFHRLRLVLLLVLVTAVFGITTQVVSTQEAPPRPSRTIEELPRLPGAEVGEGEAPSPASAAQAVILPWSKRTFQSYRDGNWEIYTSNDDGSGEARLTAHGAIDMHPRLNRGATQIAFASKRGGVYGIYTMNVDGSGVTRLTFTDRDNVYPAWSPDGTKIAFQSYRDGQAEVYIMNADGSGQTRLTADAGFDGYPAWSPDGTKIAFSSSRSGQAYIYVMNANGTGVTQLSTQMYSYNPIWSPDGSKIAYDADQGNDGWQELWVMDANGANQQMKYDPYGQIDAWAHSWSPDGRYIAYTLISFTYYQGAWYWVDAYLDALSVQQNNTVRLSSSGLDWNPDWQTTDAIKPTATAVPLPGTSPAPIAVRWSGSDTGGAGMQGYDVQVKTGVNGNWANWLTNTTLTSSAYTAVGGQTYAFRVRARDNAHNVSDWSPVNQAVTTVEALPPQTAVSPLPPFSRADEDLPVAWGGTDPGGSGIASFDLEYRLNGNSWANWLTETSLSAALLATNAQPGDVLDIRSRGRDRAQNLEPWSATADATTTFYRWGIGGQVHDNAGAPIGGAAIQTTPLALNNALSSSEGAFGSYIATVSDVYSVTVSKTGYGSLPVTGYPFGPDASVQVALPPINDVVRNGDFEAGSLNNDWTADGYTAPALNDNAHTGDWAVFIGQFAAEPGPQFPVTSYGTMTKFNTVVDREDNVHFVWFDTTSLWHRHRLTNGSWSPPVSLPGTDSYYSLAAAADEDGDVHVVLSASNDTMDIFYARWRKNNNTWSTPINISGDTQWSSSPQLAVDADGRVHVVWQSNPPGYYWSSVVYARQEANGVWSTPLYIQDDFGREGKPQIDVDVSGRVHMLWSSTNNDNAVSVRHAPFASNGSPGAFTTVIDEGRHIQWQHALAANGNIHVIWSQVDEPYATHLYHIFWNGQSWSHRSSSLFSDWISSMTMNADVDGTVRLAWQSDDSIYYRQKTANADWADVVVLGVGETVPSVVGDSDGMAHVIWSGGIYGDMPQGDAYYTRQTLDHEGWTTPVNLSPGAIGPRAGTLVADSTGYIHIAWVEGDWAEPRSIVYRGSPTSIVEANSWLETTITIPEDMTSPVLSYQYQVSGLVTGGPSHLTVAVTDNSGTTTLQTYNASAVGWRHNWVDLSSWVGETISLTFNLHQGANALLAWTYLDSVTVGTAYPDVWVSVNETNGLPGEQIEQTLTYGNRGGAVAAGTRLTYTLPAELSFVSASVPPVSTSPLVWELGELPAKSQPLTLSVVVQMSPTAVPFTTLTSTAVINPTGSELETLNNSAQGRTFIRRLLYLPMLQR